MKAFEFNKLGGIPWTQDNFDFMQQAYREPVRGIVEMGGTGFFKISGIEYTGTASLYTEGWIYYNGEVIPFLAGSSSVNIKIRTYRETLVYGDGTGYQTKYRKEASFGAGTGDDVTLSWSALKSFHDGFGDGGRGEWMPLADYTDPELTVAYYCIDKLTKMVHLRGEVSKDSTSGVSDPIVRYGVTTLPIAARPIRIIEANTTRAGFIDPNSGADIYGGVFTGEVLTINTSGLVMVTWRKLPGGAGYSQSFNFSYPLF